MNARSEASSLRRHLSLIALLLTAHVGLLAHVSARNSPTLNEPGHLVAGLSHWDTAAFTLYRVNPPLVRTVAALPVFVSGYREDWSSYHESVGARPVFEMGEDFIHSNGRRSMRLITMARWACIPFSLVGALVCFLWARDLFGYWGGYVACSLWCFSPAVLGYASTIAPDAHATSLGLAACYTFWRWLKKPTWSQAIFTGGVLGLAELAKMTFVLFYPLWPLIWVIYRFQEGGRMTRERWVREAGMLGLRMIVGIYVLNMGYLGEGSFTKLGDFQFVSEMLGGEGTERSKGGNRFRGTWMSEVYVPFPSNYLIGIDVQQRDFENFGWPSYLNGRYQAKGWWYYYAYAILVKAPIGTLGLVALTLLTQFTRWRIPITYEDTLVLLSPAVVVFTVVSLKSGFSHHVRYVLPCVPFVFIWVSQMAEHIRYAVAMSSEAVTRRGWGTGLSSGDRLSGGLIGVAAAALLCGTFASSLLVYPHSLSYFNELAGGPRNGPNHLINSNIDWGQDLLFLEKWTQDHAKGVPVYLAFYNYYNPFDLDVVGSQPWPFESDAPPQTPVVPPGYYAISVNCLYEFPWPLRGEDDRRYWIDMRPLSYLRTIEPVGWAGYSIRIFSAQQMRDAYWMPRSAPLWTGFKRH